MRKFLVHFLILVSGIFSSSSALSQAPENIYQNGKNAFNKGDCLPAVKHLFAYQRLVAGNIDPGLNDSVNSAIQYCDEQILLAIRTKQNLDKFGHITEVVIEAGGKADGGGGKSKKLKYKKPTGKHMSKPSLPSNAPKAQSTSKPFNQAKQSLAFNRQLVKADKFDERNNNEGLEKKYADLEKKYELLQEELNKESESYNALRERYERLAVRYRELRHQQQ